MAPGLAGTSYLHSTTNSQHGVDQLAPGMQVYAPSQSSKSNSTPKSLYSSRRSKADASSLLQLSGPSPLQRSESFDHFDASTELSTTQHSFEQSHSVGRSREAHSSHTRSRSLHNNNLPRDQLLHHQFNAMIIPHALSSDNVSHDLTSSIQSEEYSRHTHDSSEKLPYQQTRKPPVVPYASAKSGPSREISLDGSENSEKQYMRSTKRLVEDISRAQGATRRVAALTSACEAFDHHDESRHNIELQSGAVQVLAKMLDQSHTKDDELRMICSALEMVFRGRSKIIEDTYNRINNNFLSCLLRMLDRCEGRTVKHAEITILNITKIIFYLSKCPDLRVELCRHPDMPRFLSRVATPSLTPDCRAMRMRILANFAAASKNRIILYENNDIVDGILRVAHMDSFDLARQNAAMTLQELAASTRNHISMASNDQLLGILVKMALVEKSLVSRDSVITALQNLAYTKPNRSRLVHYKDGVVLEALKRTLSVDPDEKIRRRAAGTLTNLACDETAEAIGNHKGLLEALAIVSTKDYNAEVQNRAALALTKIAGGIHSRMSCFESLLDALVVASLSKTSNGVMAVLRLKARDTENRQAMARHKGVMDTLADVCVSATGDDRDNAMRALMHLVNDDENRSTMCNKVILHALVSGANLDEEGNIESRDSAIRSLERLATECNNRPTMARHPGLLQVVAKAVEREVKLQDSKIDSEHGYLAKPLLMTLLLSM